MERQGCVYADVKCEWPVGCEKCGWNPAEAERRKEIISSECHPSKGKPYRLILKGENNNTRLEQIQHGGEKTVANALAQYAAALMNGTAPVDVKVWLEQEADDIEKQTAEMGAD